MVSSTKPEFVKAGKEIRPRVQTWAVRLVKEGGVSVAQAARNLDLNENALRKRVREGATTRSVISPVMGR